MQTSKIKKPIDILVQRRAAIGDVIMSTALVRELKLRYGRTANIDVATDKPSVYKNNPHIRSVIPVDAATPAGYDLFVNLDDAYEHNPDVHYIDNYFYRVFGDKDCNKSVELFPSAEDKATVDNDLKEYGNKFIVVHMRNWHWAAKNISMDVWFETFVKLFSERTDFNIVCVGGETDHTVDHPLIYDARTRYNEQQIKYLCDHARTFVGIDSGPYWAAAASNVHIVALLTHLNPDVIIPYRKREIGYFATAIQTEEDCKGCNSVQATPVRQIVCSKSTFPCVNNFNVDAIVKAINRQLQ